MDLIKPFTHIIIAILASSLPLLTQTGQNLEYEYSLLVSYLILILFPLSKLIIPFRPLVGFQHLFFTLTGIASTYIPGAILFSAEMCKCSDNSWLIWHSFHVIPIFLLSLALSDLTIYIRQKFGFKSALFLLLLFFAAIPLTVMSDTFLAGMAKSHGLFSGFLHGPIYDSLILVDNGVFRTQYFYFLISLAVFWGTMEIRSVSLKKKTIYQTLSASFAFFSLFFLVDQTSHLSSTKDHSDIKTLLSKHVNLANATIHTTPRTYNTTSFQRLIPQIKFHISDLESVLKTKPSNNIQIYVYDDRIMKKKVFGGYYTDVTDVLTPSIHITPDSFPHYTLRHELIHAMLSDKGFFGLGFHPNMAITEGLAVALDNAERPFELHQAAGYLIKENKVANPSKIFSPLFWLESGSRSYSISGSIFLYVIENFGIEKALQLYSGKSWPEVFKKNSEQMITDWRNFVVSKYDKKTQDLYKNRLFKENGVLFQTCPHTRASLRLDNNNSKLFHPSKFQGSKNRLLYLTSNYPSNKSYELLNLKRKFKLDQDISQQLIYRPDQNLDSIEDISELLLLSDYFAHSGDHVKSSSILKRLLDFSASKNLGFNLTSSIKLRHTLSTSSEKDSRIWYAILSGVLKPTAPPAKNSKWEYALTYLLRAKIKPSAKYFMNFTPPENTSDTLQYLWYTEIASLAHREGEYEISLKAISKVVNLDTGLNKKFILMLQLYLMDLLNTAEQ
jgi:hypothetical protein